MKKLILTASVLALIPSAASAQLLGGGLGGTLGGDIGGSIGGTIGSTVDSTTRSVRGTIDSTAQGSTDGEQSVDARRGRVDARRSADGSANASTASLADLPIPSMLSGSASGSGSANGNANAQLIGTDAVAGTIAPVAGRARGVAASAAAQGMATAQGSLASAPTPGLPALGGVSAGGQGSGSGSAAGSLMATPLAVAGSAAGQGSGVATVTPGMPVMTPDGASLGKVKQVVADGRGQVQQVIVKQGKVTRTLPAGMFSASGDALIAGEAKGSAERQAPESQQVE